MAFGRTQTTDRTDREMVLSVVPHTLFNGVRVDTPVECGEKDEMKRVPSGVDTGVTPPEGTTPGGSFVK